MIKDFCIYVFFPCRQPLKDILEFLPEEWEPQELLMPNRQTCTILMSAFSK